MEESKTVRNFLLDKVAKEWSNQIKPLWKLVNALSLTYNVKAEVEKIFEMIFHFNLPSNSTKGSYLALQNVIYFGKGIIQRDENSFLDYFSNYFLKQQNSIIFWSSYANYVETYSPTILEQLAFLNFVISASQPTDFTKYLEIQKELVNDMILDLYYSYRSGKGSVHVMYRRVMNGKPKPKALDAFVVNCALSLVLSENWSQRNLLVETFQ